MARWVGNLFALVLLAAWLGYVVIQLVEKQQIPTFLWGVPGATIALLNYRLKTIKYGKFEVDLEDKEEDD